MNRAQIRMQALHLLYACYEAFGPQPNQISQKEIDEAVIRLGVDEVDLRRAFRELVEDGLAEGHPRPGTGMHPEDGLVWISPEGRRRIEALPASSRFDQQIREQWRPQRAGHQQRDHDVASVPTNPQSSQPAGTAGDKPGERRMLKAFLCHASEDKEAVRRLYWRLREDGVSPWLDEEDLLPGQEWEPAIRSAVRRSDVVIVCLSQQAITKEGFVQKEIKIALDEADKKPEGTIFIIPVRLEPCVVLDRLAKWQWVDLFAERGYDRLMQALSVRAEHVGAVIGMDQAAAGENLSQADLATVSALAVELRENLELLKAPRVSRRSWVPLRRGALDQAAPVLSRLPAAVAAPITAVGPKLDLYNAAARSIDTSNYPGPTLQALARDQLQPRIAEARSALDEAIEALDPWLRNQRNRF